MAKKGKKIGKQYYDFKYQEEFHKLMSEGKKDKPGKFLGFKLKNTNQNWRWDTLEG